MSTVKKLLWVAVLAIAVCGFARAAGVEARIGTGPSFSATIDWDLSQRLTLALSLGVRLGDVTQTPSARIQTPSLTLAAGLRYTLTDPSHSVVPYVGVAGEVQLRGARIAAHAQLTAGVCVRVSRTLYILGEALLAFPIAGPEGPRLELLAGVRVRF